MAKSIICLDFDGVIHSYTSPWSGPSTVSDPPVPGAFDFILELLQAGFDVHVYSARSGDAGGILAMRAWFNNWARKELPPVHADHVSKAVAWPTAKPSAKVTIDDRALTFTGSWPSLETLSNFQPWNKQASTPKMANYRDRIAMLIIAELGCTRERGKRVADMIMAEAQI